MISICLRGAFHFDVLVQYEHDRSARPTRTSSAVSTMAETSVVGVAFVVHDGDFDGIAVAVSVERHSEERKSAGVKKGFRGACQISYAYIKENRTQIRTISSLLSPAL